MTTSTEVDRHPLTAPALEAEERLSAAVQRLQSEHNIVLAYWRRDDITVPTSGSMGRPATDPEWDDIRSTLPADVYGAVKKAGCLRHAAEQALIWAVDPGDRQQMRDVLPDAVAADPQALQAWSAEQRWQQPCQDLDPRLTSDPHYPALVQALERAQAAGVDVQAALAAAVDTSLPSEHTGRTLHSRLVQAHPATVTPVPLVPPAGTVQRAASPTAAPPTPARAGPHR